MKKKFLVLAVLVCLFALVFVSCGGGSGKSAYYGKWGNKYEISANKLIESDSYEIVIVENLSWQPITMADRRLAANYPKGFEISGTVTEVKLVEKIFATVGSTRRYKVFVHNNGSMIGVYNWDETYFTEYRKN